MRVGFPGMLIHRGAKIMMMRISAGFALAALMGTTVLAADEEKKGRDPGKMFGIFDKNGDKKLSKEEFEALGDKLGDKLGKGKFKGKEGKLFERLDSNGDGSISEEEFKKLADRIGDKVDPAKLKSLIEKREGGKAEAKPAGEPELLPPPRVKE